MLDQRDDPSRHEPGGPHGSAAPGELADLDEAAPVHHLDPAARPGRSHLVSLGRIAARIDDDLDPVASHVRPTRSTQGFSSTSDTYPFSGAAPASDRQMRRTPEMRATSQAWHSPRDTLHTKPLMPLTRQPRLPRL